MTRWFRFYDDAVNDPKLLRLPDDLYRAWTILLCFASKGGGTLPPADDIAIALRMKPSKVAEWITKLVRAGLMDDMGGHFEPHNWNGRQYKSDVSTDRVKRFRNGKRNVSETANETAPEQIQKQTTESEQKDCADAPRDVRSELFGPGLQKLGRITGKGPDACRSFVGKCLKAASDDAVIVLGLIEDAERNRVVDPSAWIAARLKSTGPPAIGKPLTEFQRKQQETNDVRAQLRNYANGGGRGGNVDRVLSDDTGKRPEDLRGGPGATVLALPRASGSGGD
jgi:hypothetical protein